MKSKISNLLAFHDETVEYFNSKIKGVNKELYFADRDIRNILDKTINDLILCLVDISEELLRINKRRIPDTYKDTILACYEYVGDIALRIAPLTKHRNETIHRYLKINWQNIVTIKNKLPDMKEYILKIRKAINKK